MEPANSSMPSWWVVVNPARHRFTRPEKARMEFFLVGIVVGMLIQKMT